MTLGGVWYRCHSNSHSSLVGVDFMKKLESLMSEERETEYDKDSDSEICREWSVLLKVLWQQEHFSDLLYRRRLFDANFTP